MGEGHDVPYIFETSLIKELGRPWNRNWENCFPSPHEKISLFKVSVLLEIRFRSSCGSVALNTYIFTRLSSLRLDTPELWNWIANNPSPNPYTPLGYNRSQEDIINNNIRSRSDYENFLEKKEQEKNKRWEKQLSKESIEQDQALLRSKKKAVKSRKHRKLSEIRNKKLYSELNNYLTLKNKNILEDILSKQLKFPLPMLPHTYIKKIEKEIENIPKEQLIQLANIIPKRRPEHIRNLSKKVHKHLKQMETAK